MKALSAAVLALLAVAPALRAQQPGNPSTRVSGNGPAMLPSNLSAPSGRVITDEELTALRNARGGGPDTVKPLPPRKHGLSLMDMSTVLSFNGQYTLLPKGCIIVTPEPLKSRIVTTSPTGAVLTWQQFFTANRNWITTSEISLKQVRGEEPLSPVAMQTLKSRSVLVVATLNGNPVTVLPYSPENRSK